MTYFAVLSTGEQIGHPKDWERCERRLKRYQRRLSRCQKGSRNRAKARVRVAKTYARVTDARRDFLHKASTRLVQRFDMIAIEDLNLRGMVMNRPLAREGCQSTRLHTGAEIRSDWPHLLTDFRPRSFLRQRKSRLLVHRSG